MNKNLRIHFCDFCVFRDLSRVPEMKRERRNRRKKFHIVTSEWVRECVEEGELSSERQFEPT